MNTNTLDQARPQNGNQTSKTGKKKKWLLRGFACCTLILVVPILLLVTCIACISYAPSDYTLKTKTGGSIEAKYLAMGSHAVKSITVSAEEPMNMLTVFYPEDLESNSKIWPVVVQTNGTGALPKKYPAVFKHLASWGFIVIGNDDPSTWSGESVDKTLDWLLKENEREGSVFYRKVDFAHIGISGHSQGGVGVFNAITEQPHGNLYRAAAALSPTNEELCEALSWTCSLSEIKAPLLMLAGTQSDFETEVVIPFEAMKNMYAKVNGPKLMMRKTGCHHGETLYSADGYVTAWFMWLLQDDKEAAQAFIGEKPELLTNPLYQDQKVNLGSLTVPDEAETEKIRGMD